MENFTYAMNGGGTCHIHIHSKAELKAAWYATDKQGNREAEARGRDCVVVICPNEDKALELSALFHRFFAIESCCHWDGQTLSMYCGDAGSGCSMLKHGLTQRLIGMRLLPDPFISK